MIIIIMNLLLLKAKKFKVKCEERGKYFCPDCPAGPLEMKLNVWDVCLTYQHCVHQRQEKLLNLFPKLINVKFVKANMKLA